MALKATAWEGIPKVDEEWGVQGVLGIREL